MAALSGAQTTIVVLTGVCLFFTGIVVVLAMRVSRVARLVAQGPSIGDGAAASALRQDLDDVDKRLRRVDDVLARLQRVTESSIKHVGVVRYDAFRDMGGYMSFSLALLDDRRNGVVLSVLNGRDGSRGYAKSVEGGHSASALSEEEQEALSQALGVARVT